jgi:chaperonin GroES
MMILLQMIQMMMMMMTTTIPTVCYGYTILHQQQPSIRNVYHSLQQRQIVPILKALQATPTTSTTRPTTKLCSTSTRSSSSNSITYTLDGQEIRQEITAMNNILFVKVKESISTTTGGIVLPDQSKIRPTEGIVIASGPGKIHPYTGKRITNPIPIGMSVL